MLKKGGSLCVAGAVAAVLLATSHSFSFAPSQPQQSQRCSALSLIAEQDDNIIIKELESTNDVSNRRGFLSQLAASASFLLSSSLPQQANAFPDEPTLIEISVDTEYFIRVLDYFDGDMRKALGVLIRAPSTQVEIDAPARGGGNGSINPRDAVLNALSSYNEEEYAVQQASWVKVDKPNRTLELLLKKRYALSLPSVGSAEDAEQVEIVLKDGGTVQYTPMKLERTKLSLSNLEAGIGLAVASYPLAYGLYNYESFREEEEKKLKKAQMAAKKAKAAAVKKAKAKGSPKKKEKKATNVDKSKPTMKGQETKKPPIDTSTVDVNFDAASKEAEWFQSETALMSKIENDEEKEPEFEWWKKNKETSPAEEATPADVADDTKGAEWFGRDVSETAVMELMQEVQQQAGYLDGLSKSQSSQGASPPPYKRKQAASKKKSSSSFSSYLDSL